MKKLIATIGVLLLCSFGIYASQKEYKPISAEGESSEILDSSEPVESSEPQESSEPEEQQSSEEQQESAPVEEPVVEEPEEDVSKEIAAKLNVFKDTFLVPLVSGVSITNLISCAVAIIFAYKNRKTNENINNSNNKTQELSLKAIEAAVALKKSAELLIEKVQNDSALTTEMKQDIFEQANFIRNNFDNFAKEVEKMLEIKTCVLMLIQVQAKLAETNPQAVSSGVMKQISELNEQAKKLL